MTPMAQQLADREDGAAVLKAALEDLVLQRTEVKTLLKTTLSVGL